MKIMKKILINILLININVVLIPKEVNADST